jgi:hypothetical protein
MTRSENKPSIAAVKELMGGNHENWLEANRYLNMNDLKEMKKADLRQAA